MLFRSFTINQTTGALTSVGTTATSNNSRYVACDPSGKFVYVSNNASNTVHAFIIDQTTGALTSVGTTATGSSPLDVACDPTGKFVYVTNNNSTSGNTVQAYRISNFGTGSGYFLDSLGIGTTTPTATLDVVGTINTTAFRSRISSTTDAIILSPRVGGSNSYSSTITTAGLTANRTITIPDTTGTLITSGDVGTITSTMLAFSAGVSGIALGQNLRTLTIGTGLSGTSYNGSTDITIALANTTVTAGTYTNANITVDSQGRITSASSNIGGGGGATVLFPKTYNIVGPVFTQTGLSRWTPPALITINTAYMSCSTAPTTGSLVVSINKNGTSIGTVTIAQNQYVSSIITINTSATTTDAITVDVTAANGAADVTLSVYYTQ